MHDPATQSSRLSRRGLLAGSSAALVTTGVALVGARGGFAQEASPAASPEASPEASPVATPGAGGDEVTVEAGDIYFEPREVAIPADTDVTFVLPNVGTILHTFNIDELDINVEIDPGATEEVVINAPAGEYEYYCSVPGHRAAGQWGTLTVE